FLFTSSATTEIYSLSLHDALPISTWFDDRARSEMGSDVPSFFRAPQGLSLFSEWLCLRACLADLSRIEDQRRCGAADCRGIDARSEEHTSELQSRRDLVCRLLLEK